MAREFKWLAMSVMLVSATATAQDDAARSEEVMRQGLLLRADGRTLEAMPLLEQAHRLAPTGRSHAQLGFALHELERWLEAYRHLTGALQTSDSFVERYRHEVERSLDIVREHVGMIHVSTQVEGAEMIVNDVTHVLPLVEPVAVLAGPVDILVRAHGFVPQRRQLVVPPGAALREVIELQPVLEEEPSRLEPRDDTHVDEPSEVPNPVVEHTDVASTDAGPDRTRNGLWTAGWVVTGVAAASLLSSLVTYRTALSRHDEWNSDACLAGPTRGETCESVFYSARRQRAASIATAAMGSALAITGLLFLLNSTQVEDSAAAIACYGSGIVGLECSYSY